MRKWKPGCHLKKQMIRDETGITLVELLAALSILSVVILLGGAIHMFGQRQFLNQTESAEHANDLSYALSVLSSDLRKQEPSNINISDDYTITVKGEEESDPDIKYCLDRSTNELKKNGAVLSDSVSEMTAAFDGTDIGIEITLISSSRHSPQKEYSTKVIFRRLPENAPQNE